PPSTRASPAPPRGGALPRPPPPPPPPRPQPPLRLPRLRARPRPVPPRGGAWLCGDATCGFASTERPVMSTERQRRPAVLFIRALDRPPDPNDRAEIARRLRGDEGPLRGVLPGLRRRLEPGGGRGRPRARFSRLKPYSLQAPQRTRSDLASVSHAPP